MQRAVIKPVLFLGLWYECGVELGLGGTAAFIVALLLWMAFGFLLRGFGMVLNLLGPQMTRLLLAGLVWLALFWWLAPAIVRDAPWLAIAAGIGALVLAGAKAREVIEARSVQEDHPRGAIAMLIAVTGAAGLALWPELPLLTLLGYLALPGIPFRMGWSRLPRAAPRRADARFGDEAAFRDARLSEDR